MPIETDVETDVHFKSIIFCCQLSNETKKCFAKNRELLFLILKI